MSGWKKLAQAAAGGGAALNVENVFSTYIHDGTGATRSITNGIDLAGEGGLVWVKTRGSNEGHGFFDTERGTGKFLRSNTTEGEITDTATLTSFNSDGFTTGADNNNGIINYDWGVSYASWTFRKAPKFFDVVTYTGNGVAGRTISHNLNGTVGCFFIKRLDTAKSWWVYHRGTDSTAPEDYYLRLESTAAKVDSAGLTNDTPPTSSVITLGNNQAVNQSGGSYVAYIFAHNDGDGEFGPTGDQDIIKCGGFTTTSTGTGSVDIGFEPQWMLIKSSSQTGTSWNLADNMRGWAFPKGSTDTTYRYLHANASTAEGDTYLVDPTSTGFDYRGAGGSRDYVYIAIRRGPMGLPESGDDVFETATRDATEPSFDSGWPVDMAVYYNNITTLHSKYLGSRMQGIWIMSPNSSGAVQDLSAFKWDYMDGYYETTGTSTNYISHMWRRYPQCFDVACYTGNGTAGRTVDHNLEVAPEMMWVKRTDASANWQVYHSSQGAGKYSPSFRTDPFYTSSGRWNNTTPTSSVFTLGNDNDVNASGGRYVAYLFATLSNVSKVGSYSGTGSNINVDCGFSNGAKFIMIKRADTEIQSTTHWYVWDSLHGIVAGNDPYLMWNNVTAQVTNTDYIDPLSSGFTVTSSANSGLNASGGTYIFYAVAA